MISFIFLCVVEWLGGWFHATIGNLQLIETRHNEHGAYTHVWIKGKWYGDISTVFDSSYHWDIKNCRLIRK